jgi:hypothetical protein
VEGGDNLNLPFYPIYKKIWLVGGCGGGQELDFQKCRLKDENTPFWQIFEIFFSFDISNGQVVRRSV